MQRSIAGLVALCVVVLLGVAGAAHAALPGSGPADVGFAGASGRVAATSAAATTSPAPGLKGLSNRHAEVSMVAAAGSVAPGGEIWIGLRINHEPHWHTYWMNPGDSGLPTQFDLELPQGVKAELIVWPRPHRIFVPPLANYGFEGDLLLPRLVRVPADYKGTSLDIKAKAAWLICKDVCIPGDAELSLSIPVRPGSAAPSAHLSLFEQSVAATPKDRLKVMVRADGPSLSLWLPASVSGAGRAEFFAGVEEVLVHAAPQSLYRQADGRYRLDLVLAADKKPDFSKDALKAAGVIDIDGKVWLVDPVLADAATLKSQDSGVLVATLKGAPDVPAASSPAERLLASSGAGAGGQANATQKSPEKVPPTSGTTLWLSILGALTGGLILNLMPCVFPVIGLKLLSFAGHGGSGLALTMSARRRLRVETSAFALGVILSFLVLGGLMLALRSAGQAVGWGFQLQSPLFVGAMFFLFVALALNFAGAFEMGMSLTRLGNVGQAPDGADRSRPLNAFFAGALAVLVATPCTAPFMGSALGFSLAQPAHEALLIFAALGVGMALPYLLLAAFPAWLTHLPRPGRWMETFKQFLSFPMLAAAVWLLWVFGLQTSVDGLMKLALGGVMLALALWLYGRIVQASSLRGWRAHLAKLAALLATLGALWSLASQRDEMVATANAATQGGSEQTMGAAASNSKAATAKAAWQPWSAQAVQQALAAGRPVFVDFTAAWCVSCQANKKLVLESTTIVQAFAAQGVLTLRGDWTRQDPLITAELARHGRSGVPLYLYYRPGQSEPEILPELLTQGLVMSAISGAPR